MCILHTYIHIHTHTHIHTYICIYVNIYCTRERFQNGNVHKCIFMYLCIENMSASCIHTHCFSVSQYVAVCCSMLQE